MLGKQPWGFFVRNSAAAAVKAAMTSDPQQQQEARERAAQAIAKTITTERPFPRSAISSAGHPSTFLSIEAEPDDHHVGRPRSRCDEIARAVRRRIR